MTLGMCGHTYCRECVIKFVESGCVSNVGCWDPISGPAQCPECRIWSEPMCIKPNRILIGNAKVIISHRVDTLAQSTTSTTTKPTYTTISNSSSSSRKSPI
mmetsp:Transcript_16009/g.13600  ORF Transcript_16009/g.13600 Transcript_16009/m.13600 type:complete len:101 (-) Transcript_16009:8-310(-)